MALPSIMDVAQDYLFSDHDKMVASGVPAATIRHLERLRDMYNYWVSFPSKRDRDIVAELRKRYGLGDTAARDDLRLIKTLLGNMERATKDYHRYRFCQMITKAYEKADAANNTRDMVAAAAQYAKYFQLDKDDERASIIDKVVPVRLTFTDDPTVLGFSRMPDFRKKIKEAKDRYFIETTEEVSYEEIDAGIDDLFGTDNNPDDGNREPAGIS